MRVGFRGSPIDLCTTALSSGKPDTDLTWCDAFSALSGQQGEDGSVGGSEARPINLSLQNEHLMAQREDLGVFAITTHQEQPDTGNQKPEQVRKDR